MPVTKTFTLRPLLLTTALAVAGVVACSGQNAANAQTPLATQQAAPAPELVAGLPDFTRLVEQVGPAVVSVQAEIGSKPQKTGRLQQIDPDQEGDDEIPEFFRRFFGPGMVPMPGMPGQPNARPRGTSLGTGFIISADGYILTNHHVIDGADTVRVRLADRRELTAKVVGSDPQSDVALLKVTAKDLPVMRIGDSSGIKPGQWVVAIGSPFGLDHSVTAGIVSAVGRSNPGSDQRYVPFIQTDVAINRGNSGGPLLNTRGQVVGINSQIFSNSGGYQGISFAIPIDVAMNAVQQLKTTGKVTRAQLGVQLQNRSIDRDQAMALGLPDTRGALVNTVSPDSPAEKAGIKRMDVIRSVNDRAINEFSDLPPIIGSMIPGEKVTVELMRDGKRQVVVATLDLLVEGSHDASRRGENPQYSSTLPASPLGIVGENLNALQRRQFGLQENEGVLIVYVEGEAREAGLRPGDVILAVGRNDVGSVIALNVQLQAVAMDQAVMLLVWRGGSAQYMTVHQSNTKQ